MKTEIKSFILSGIRAVPVKIETFLDNGIGIHMVGMRDNLVKESLLRVITAMMSLGYSVPGKKIVIEITTEDGNPVCSGSESLDLPIAASILLASETWYVSPYLLKRYAIVGELGLDGAVRPIRGAYNCALASKNIILPANDAALLKENPGVAYMGRVLAVNTLDDVREALYGNGNLADTMEAPELPLTCCPDTGFIEGAYTARRAIEIAAAGGHSICLVGDGAAHLANCLRGILPKMSSEEYILSELVHQAAGRHIPVGDCRPMREPVLKTLAGIIGGGNPVLPGEVSLAHNGMLVLHDADNWPKSITETLRHIDGEVTISRLRSKVTYPADFLLVGTVRDNWRVPEDLFDICCDVQDMKILQEKSPTAGDSDTLRERVTWARTLQKARCGKLNAKLTPTETEMACRLPEEVRETIDRKAAKINRPGYAARIKRIARTIADLEGSETVDAVHVIEAIQFAAR